MSPLLKHVRLFWVCAIFLMALGQAAHAYEDWSHSGGHSAECQPTDKSGDPVGHPKCCHGHSHGIGIFPSTTPLSLRPQGVEIYFDRENSLIEGPVREIDYPPQLS